MSDSVRDAQPVSLPTHGAHVPRDLLNFAAAAKLDLSPSANKTTITYDGSSAAIDFIIVFDER